MDSKRADASSYVRFGKRNPESSDDFLSNLLEVRNEYRHGGVDKTVIDCRQIQLGQMAEFSSPLNFLNFDL